MQNPSSLIARRRRHGPEPLPANDRRTHCVSVRLNPAELAQLDAKRGRLARGEWLRAAALHHLPPAPPGPVAVAQWQQLARVGANLNQLAAAINSARLSGAALPDLDAIRAVLVDLRNGLIGARNAREDTE
jgi:hypothetical protein